MKNMSKEHFVIIISLSLIFIIGVAILIKQNSDRNMVYSSISSDRLLSSEVDNPYEPADDRVNADREKIVVHVAGEVFFTGVYELPQGSRVIDAINLAGGSKSTADLDSINLAAIIKDEQKIYIPSVTEDSLINHSNSNPAIHASSNKININTATAMELQKLNGIGESRANSIIKYRNENGSFRSIEEIKNISGIGDRILDNIREEITIR
ncbi:helix-hairpin-helix domain-containing protein [Natronospora cellulosivora (SeqCode)]